MSDILIECYSEDVGYTSRKVTNHQSTPEIELLKEFVFNYPEEYLVKGILKTIMDKYIGKPISMITRNKIVSDVNYMSNNRTIYLVLDENRVSCFGPDGMALSAEFIIE